MSPRYYCPDLGTSNRVELDAELTRHVAKVLRLGVGAEIELFDGRGTTARGQLLELRRGRALVEVVERDRPPAQPLRQVELCFAPPKPGRFEQVLEHGTELGVRAFRPVVTARTTPAWHRATKRARLERILAAAAGQSGLLELPELHEPCTLDALIQGDLAAFDGERWVARRGPRAAVSPRRPEDHAPAIVVVGPEGGLVTAELEALATAGCRPLDLGPTTLRCETAALAAAIRLLQAPPEAPD